MEGSKRTTKSSILSPFPSTGEGQALHHVRCGTKPRTWYGSGVGMKVPGLAYWRQANAGISIRAGVEFTSFWQEQNFKAGKVAISRRPKNQKILTHEYPILCYFISRTGCRAKLRRDFQETCALEVSKAKGRCHHHKLGQSLWKSPFFPCALDFFQVRSHQS